MPDYYSMCYYVLLLQEDKATHKKSRYGNMKKKKMRTLENSMHFQCDSTKTFEHWYRPGSNNCLS